MKKITITSLLIMTICSTLLGQTDNNIIDGKMDTVIYVLAVILAGIFIYLFYLDRKLSQLEKNINNE